MNSEPLIWWSALSSNWQKAFLDTCNGHDTELNPFLELIQIRSVFRFAGPRAPYPNMDFEISDISGIVDLLNIEILVLTHHQIKDLKGIDKLKNLKSLFILDNQIQNLEPLQFCANLEELYFQNNEVISLEPLARLDRLHTIYACDNKIENLSGIHKNHTRLKNFIVRPNEQLPYSEILKFELETGIECKKTSMK